MAFFDKSTALKIKKLVPEGRKVVELVLQEVKEEFREVEASSEIHERRNKRQGYGGLKMEFLVGKKNSWAVQSWTEGKSG